MYSTAEIAWAEMKATTKMLESYKCVKLLLKRLIVYDSKVSSAHLKSPSKCLQSTKIDSPDHFENFIPGKYVSIVAVFGPKSGFEVEPLF